MHGGEPLLFGKTRFVGLMDELTAIEERTQCMIVRSLTTNGVLIDEEWASLFRLFDVNVTVSIDGPEHIHNQARVDFKGRGTYNEVMRGVTYLREQGLEPGVLAVCDPASDPAATMHHFVELLGFTSFDILIPDIIYDDAAMAIAPYYIALFDLWYHQYLQQGIAIRYLQLLVGALVENIASMKPVAYNPVETLTILTDGALEPVDVLRIAGNGSTRTELSILTHTLQDLTLDPCWRAAYQATINLPAVCQECAYHTVCGGGYLPHRWSAKNGYDNPSVYCADLKQLYSHIWNRIEHDLRLSNEHSRLIPHEQG